MTTNLPHVAVLMDNQSDWDTMQLASETLHTLDIPHECRTLSTHPVQDDLVKYIEDSENRGVRVFIASAGNAAHLAANDCRQDRPACIRGSYATKISRGTRFPLVDRSNAQRYSGGDFSSRQRWSHQCCTAGRRHSGVERPIRQ